MSNIWVAVITAVGLIVAQVVVTWRSNNTQEVRTAAKIDSIVQDSKASCEAILYRISELEKKQDKHNGLIERMCKVEQQLKDKG
jgi:hypothetical protein